MATGIYVREEKELESPRDVPPIPSLWDGDGARAQWQFVVALGCCFGCMLVCIFGGLLLVADEQSHYAWAYAQMDHGWVAVNCSVTKTTFTTTTCTPCSAPICRDGGGKYYGDFDSAVSCQNINFIVTVEGQSHQLLVTSPNGWRGFSGRCPNNHLDIISGDQATYHGQVCYSEAVVGKIQAKFSKGSTCYHHQDFSNTTATTTKYYLEKPPPDATELDYQARGLQYLLYALAGCGGCVLLGVLCPYTRNCCWVTLVDCCCDVRGCSIPGALIAVVWCFSCGLVDLSTLELSKSNKPPPERPDDLETYTMLE